MMPPYPVTFLKFLAARELPHLYRILSFKTPLLKAILSVFLSKRDINAVCGRLSVSLIYQCDA